MEGDRRRATRETTNDGRRAAGDDDEDDNGDGRAEAKAKWKGEGEDGRSLSESIVCSRNERGVEGQRGDGRSLSGLLPVGAMGEELQGARRARHQKVSEFRILIRTRGA